MNDVQSLRERAKELRCLYRVQDAVADRSSAPPEVFLRVLEAIPDGWQDPARVGARIEYLGRAYVGPGYSSEGASISAPIRVGKTDVGHIEVVNSDPASEGARPAPEVGTRAETFLREEHELLGAIARRLGEYLEWKHTQLLGERVPSTTEHWRWRQEYAEALVAELDRARFGVSRVLLGGSTETGSAGAGSDIDLFVEFHGTPEQRRELTAWIEGWSSCLAELAYRQTGYRIAGGLIDLHFLDASTDPRTLSEYRELLGRTE